MSDWNGGNVLVQRMERARYDMHHIKNLGGAHSVVDSGPPVALSRPPPMPKNQVLRKKAAVEAAMADVKMVGNIAREMTRPPGLTVLERKGPVSLNVDRRKKELRRIDQENERMLKRLESVRSGYSKRSQDRSYEQSRKHVALASAASLGRCEMYRQPPPMPAGNDSRRTPRRASSEPADLDRMLTSSDEQFSRSAASSAEPRPRAEPQPEGARFPRVPSAERGVSSCSPRSGSPAPQQSLTPRLPQLSSSREGTSPRHALQEAPARSSSPQPMQQRRPSPANPARPSERHPSPHIATSNCSAPRGPASRAGSRERLGPPQPQRASSRSASVTSIGSSAASASTARRAVSKPSQRSSVARPASQPPPSHGSSGQARSSSRDERRSPAAAISPEAFQQECTGQTAHSSPQHGDSHVGHNSGASSLQGGDQAQGALEGSSSPVGLTAEEMVARSEAEAHPGSARTLTPHGGDASKCSAEEANAAVHAESEEEKSAAALSQQPLLEEPGGAAATSEPDPLPSETNTNQDKKEKAEEAEETKEKEMEEKEMEEKEEKKEENKEENIKTQVEKTEEKMEENKEEKEENKEASGQVKGDGEEEEEEEEFEETYVEENAAEVAVRPDDSFPAFSCDSSKEGQTCKAELEEPLVQPAAEGNSGTSSTSMQEELVQEAQDMPEKSSSLEAHTPSERGMPSVSELQSSHPLQDASAPEALSEGDAEPREVQTASGFAAEKEEHSAAVEEEPRTLEAQTPTEDEASAPELMAPRTEEPSSPVSADEDTAVGNMESGPAQGQTKASVEEESGLPAREETKALEEEAASLTSKEEPNAPSGEEPSASGAPPEGEADSPELRSEADVPSAPQLNATVEEEQNYEEDYEDYDDEDFDNEEEEDESNADDAESHDGEDAQEEEEDGAEDEEEEKESKEEQEAAADANHGDSAASDSESESDRDEADGSESSVDVPCDLSQTVVSIRSDE